MKCLSGETGRRVRFRFVWFTPCGFKSHLGHFFVINEPKRTFHPRIFCKKSKTSPAIDNYYNKKLQ